MNGFHDPDRMYMERFGDIHVFRPRLETELEVRAEAEQHLRARFNIGRYDNKNEINAILHHNFAFYSGLLDQVLPGIASIHFLKFVLFHFDQYTQVDRLQREEQLDREEDDRWTRIGPSLRRAAKYLAERMCFIRPREAPRADERQLLGLSERAWIGAEQVINLYMESDLAFIAFPGQTLLEIFPPGEELYLQQTIVGDCPDLAARVRYDGLDHVRFIPDAPILSNLDTQDQYIGAAVQDVVGLNYRNTMGVLAHVVRGCRAAPGGFPIPFMHKERMNAENRELWRPNREFRAFRRAFFEVPHATGEHFVFSPGMAEDAFTILIREAAFGQFPQEWRSDQLTQELGRLGNAAGRWFERVVEHNCQQISFVGQRSATHYIGSGEMRIRIPPDIGEIDFIGYSERERILLILECKLVRYSFEARYHRDDIYDFALSDQSHANKFRRKCAWVQNNLRQISAALNSLQPLRNVHIVPMRLARAIITLHPTMATCFIDDVPCVSLAELMLDYEAMENWPYEIGVSEINI